MPLSKADAWKRALVLAVLALLAWAAWHAGLVDALRDIDRLRALVRDLGPWAYVAFVASFAVLQPLGLLAIFWVLPAALIWPFPLAFALSLTGAVCAASIGFAFARYVGREWVAARLPGRLQRLDERIAANGLRSVVLVRLVFHLSPPTHWVFGLSRLRLRSFVAGTALGIAPHIAIVTWFGESALNWLGNQSAITLAAIAAAGIAVAIALGARRRRRRAVDASVPQP